MRRADSDPVKQLSSSFNGTTPTKQATIFESSENSEALSHVSTPKIGLQRIARVNSEDEDEGVIDALSFTPKKDLQEDEQELNIEGALTDELKILQDKNRHLYQQIEVHVHVHTL